MNRCPTCSQPIDKQKITINRLMVSALLKAYRYGSRKGLKSVRIRDLDLTRSEYGMMSCLITFGLLYRSPDMKKGEYGIPYNRVQQFIYGNYTVPEYYLANPIKGLYDGKRMSNELSEKRITIHQVKKISEIQELYGECMTQFIPQEIPIPDYTSLI